MKQARARVQTASHVMLRPTSGIASLRVQSKQYKTEYDVNMRPQIEIGRMLQHEVISVHIGAINTHLQLQHRGARAVVVRGAMPQLPRHLQQKNSSSVRK